MASVPVWELLEIKTGIGPRTPFFSNINSLPLSPKALSATRLTAPVSFLHDGCVRTLGEALKDHHRRSVVNGEKDLTD